MQQGIRFNEGLAQMALLLLVFWFHITHRQKLTGHTRTNIVTETCKYILTLPVICAQQQHVLHWMSKCLIQKFTLRNFKMSLLFKNYSLVEVICVLIRFNKFPLSNTKNTDKNGINGQNTHTTDREKDNFRKS